MKKVNFISFDTKSAKGVGGNPYFILVSLSLLMLLSAVYFTHTSLNRKRLFYTSDKEKGVQVARVAEKTEPPKAEVTNEIKEESPGIKEKEEGGGNIERKGQLPVQLSAEHKYFLSICRCLVKENAESAMQELNKLGYTPIMQQDMTQAKMYNVYSEAFEESAQGIKLLEHLKGNGFDSLLIQMPDGKYTLRIVSCYYKESARDAEQRLKRLEVAGRIVHESTETIAYSVLIGGFDSVQGAKITQEKLLHNGYKTFVLKR